jgi:hypothetical protein
MDGKAFMILLVLAVGLIALALPHDSMGWLLFVIGVILFVEWVIPAIRAHLNKKRGLLAS